MKEGWAFLSLVFPTPSPPLHAAFPHDVSGSKDKGMKAEKRKDTQQMESRGRGII